jgi:uncharacterized protein
MSPESLIWTRANHPVATLLLAHGAGVGMESPFMNGIATRLAEAGMTVARFEFAYMAARRSGGRKRPPPSADSLVGEYRDAIEAAQDEADLALLIGGKSMGGRVAAMVAADPPDRVVGAICLGYPFHAPGTTERLRLGPLQVARLPVLVCQGDRDPFGSASEIAAYDLSKTVSVVYLEDGDHDFKPRGRSPATWSGNLDLAARAVCTFAARLVEEKS